MIDSLLNLLFRCSHRRLTRPVTPAGSPQGGAYVVCLDCGKQFPYDTKEMRMGKAVATANDLGVLRPDAPKPPRAKLKYAFWAGLPLGLLAGLALKRKPPAGPAAGGSSEPAAPRPRVKV